MRRAYRRDKYLTILDKVRAAIPDAAITTDIIVGFPGETERDFADTLDLVRRARFSGAFTFRYSVRPGTPAATMDGQVPAAVVQERYERLIALVEETSLDGNLAFVGRQAEVLVADGEGRKDDVTHRMSGRARDNRLVHFTPGSIAGGSGPSGPGPWGVGGVPREGTAPEGTCPPGQPGPAPGRHRDHRGDPRRAALPDRGRRAAGRPPDQGRRRLGGPARERPPGILPAGRARRGTLVAGCCSACRP